MLLTNEYYQNVKDYLHPNIHTFVNHYRDANITCFPNYHGCNHKNKNRKKINMNQVNNVLSQLINLIGKKQKINTNMDT